MKNKPTIAIVAHDAGGLGGMEIHLNEMIMRLKEDYHVTVVASSLQVTDSEGVTFIKIPVIKRPVPIRLILFAIFASIRLLFVKRDILHTTGAIVFNRADFSTVHFCHSGYLKATGGSRVSSGGSFFRKLNSGLASFIARTMERIVYRPGRTKRLLAVSNRVREEVLADFPYMPEQVGYLPNGVDIHKFKSIDDETKKKLRKQYGIPEEGHFLLFMGGDWPRKGLDLVIEAFNQAAERFPDLYLLVVGKGEREMYQKMVSPSFRERVLFTGKQSEPHHWFGMSDIFVFPSSYETFSLVVHEAAAAGMIVISTKVGGVEDLIANQVNGFILNRDRGEIAAALIDILSDVERYRVFGERARARVEQLTWENMHRILIRHYEENDQRLGQKALS
ncbi:glycosyltransferase family 4 protein [Paenibacillus allorhizosphaerae]|uniref:D-inositol-3-phosphate glycosyltransferase n=1 Tax=Paenibacillus allorhizosphaerae TaxID=2849866 RepID=A0ABN7TIM0_9BACL|nr:glycosyltransferase family 4 protein [Paenibacillus allorhizosphaerae]CAG7632704.1 D-inositol-3-phosphate glycosyltransferase [Paenibacillus allorhizosphaerae]